MTHVTAQESVTRLSSQPINELGISVAVTRDRRNITGVYGLMSLISRVHDCGVSNRGWARGVSKEEPFLHRERIFDILSDSLNHNIHNSHLSGSVLQARGVRICRIEPENAFTSFGVELGTEQP